MSFQEVKSKLKRLYREESTSVIRLIFCKLLMQLQAVLYILKYRALVKLGRKRMSDLRRTRASKVFVFANGPSLSDIDFKKIKSLVDKKEYDLITINSFASKVMKDYGIRPTVGVFVDPSHYREKDDPKYSKQSEADILAMNDMDSVALVPYQYYHKTQFKKSIPCCMCSNIYSKNVSDVNRPLGFYGRTAFYALSLSFDLGYESIYICGYDNSYFKTYCVDEDNNQFFKNEHFYQSSKLYLPSEKYGPTSHIFFDIYQHFKYLEKIRDLSAAKVFNIAKVTYTDAFARDFSLDVYE